MDAQGIVVLPGQGQVSSTSPGRAFALKLLGGATGDSIMLFEETVPAGTKSTFKIGDETTVGGPGTCAFMPRGVPHAWKSTGAETGRVLFLYTPAEAGGLLEEQHRTRRTFASMTEREVAEICQRHGWEIVGPSPL